MESGKGLYPQRLYRPGGRDALGQPTRKLTGALQEEHWWFGFEHITPSLLDPTMHREREGSICLHEAVCVGPLMVDMPRNTGPRKHHQPGFLPKSLLLKTLQKQDSLVAATLSLKHGIHIIRRVRGQHFHETKQVFMKRNN